MKESRLGLHSSWVREGGIKVYGPIEIRIRDRRISYEFTLHRKFTFITGDSGNGKTLLITMVEV
jgi:ABC-type ATPase involved in cell division